MVINLRGIIMNFPLKKHPNFIIPFIVVFLTSLIFLQITTIHQPSIIDPDTICFVEWNENSNPFSDKLVWPDSRWKEQEKI